MGGLIHGLNTGKSALLHNQLGMNVVGHNIANASNPSFTRQRVNAAPAHHAQQGNLLGAGIYSLGIESARDGFLDARVREDRSMLGYWSSMESSLGGVEGILAENGEYGLSTVLGEFWNGWSEVASHPEDEAVRSAVLSAGVRLSSTMNKIASDLSGEAARIEDELEIAVAGVNTLASRIAGLNAQVIESEAGGNSANDLRDERDAAVDQLSDYAGVSVTEQENGSISVSLGGHALVEHDSISPLTWSTADAEAGTGGLTAESGETVELEGGTLGGLVEMASSVMPGLRNRLDTLAGIVIEQVNQLHREGYALDGKTTGIEFFTGNDASTISVSAAVRDNPSMVAASATGSSSDNGIANALFALGDNPGMVDGLSINGYYDSFIVDIGMALQEAQNQVELGSGFVSQSEMQRQSVRGVNLDEEMIDLIKYQNAYDAAATVISTVDEMVQSVISMVV